jgi:hypothetical protein
MGMVVGQSALRRIGMQMRTTKDFLKAADLPKCASGLRMQAF